MDWQQADGEPLDPVLALPVRTEQGRGGHRRPWRNSETGRKAIKEADEEAVRLLYVGVTRARDHVVLCTAGKGNVDWLDRLAADPVTPHVILPTASGRPLVANGKDHAVRSASWVEGEPVDVSPEAPFIALPRTMAVHEPLRIRPSDAASDEGTYTFTHANLYGEIPISGNPEMDDLGSALHAIFAVDDRGREIKARIETAKTILARWGITGVHPDEVIAAADRFWKHLEKRFPTGKVMREVPVHAYDGLQVISGRIDLLIEGPDDEDWFVVYDHKSFPGPPTSGMAMPKACAAARKVRQGRGGRDRRQEALHRFLRPHARPWCSHRHPSEEGGDRGASGDHRVRRGGA